MAEDYGFADVFIPEDFYAADPAISPFSTSPPPRHAKEIPKGTKIDAIFVFSDPCDWPLSIQVITDVLLSDNGGVGTRRDPEDVGPHVPLYFSNPDHPRVSTYPYSRLGQGAFHRAVCGTYNRYIKE